MKKNEYAHAHIFKTWYLLLLFLFFHYITGPTFCFLFVCSFFFSYSVAGLFYCAYWFIFSFFCFHLALVQTTVELHCPFRMVTVIAVIMLKKNYIVIDFI